MLSEIDNYYLRQIEPYKSCLLALRHIILNQDSYVSETRKWGMPCFYFKKKMFCFLRIDKKTNSPYILMVEGQHLKHPMLEQGDRLRMKIFRINPAHDLPIDEINTLLNEALDLYRKGYIKYK